MVLSGASTGWMSLGVGQDSGEQGQVGPASGIGLVWEAVRSHSGPPKGKATL